MQSWAAVIVTTAASICLAFMMLVVCADVILRMIDPKWRITGTLDYVELSLDWMVYLAIAAALFAGQIISVDIIDHWDTRGRLKVIGLIATVCILCVLASQIVRPALSVLEWGEVTLDLGIPKFYYWLAIWFGVGLSVLAVLLRIVTSLRGQQ